MRTAIAGPVTPLLGSLGLHGGVVLALFIAVHRPAALAPSHSERGDFWAGNAVEVDAVATPDQTASLPSDAPAAAQARAAEEPSPTAPAGVEKAAEALDRPTTKPAPVHSSSTPAPKRAPAHSERTAPSPVGGSSTETGAGAPATGAFGSEGLPPGVRSLPSAFTRAIPPATGADPIWQTLPTGSLRPFTIAIQVGEDGHIQSADVLKERDGSAAEPPALHLRERVQALLGGGLFALQNEVGAGRALFRVTITLSDRAVHDEDHPAELVERGFDPPRGASAGRAYFTLASGRHFEARVLVLNRP